MPFQKARSEHVSTAEAARERERDSDKTKGHYSLVFADKLKLSAAGQCIPRLGSSFFPCPSNISFIAAMGPWPGMSSTRSLRILAGPWTCRHRVHASSLSRPIVQGCSPNVTLSEHNNSSPPARCWQREESTSHRPCTSRACPDAYPKGSQGRLSLLRLPFWEPSPAGAARAANHVTTTLGGPVAHTEARLCGASSSAIQTRTF